MEHVDVKDSDGPGNCAMLRVCSGGRTSVFTAFGQKGKPSRKVINEVAGETRDYLSSDAAVDLHLADQLPIYRAITKSGSFTTNKLTTHLTTNIETIKKFLPVKFNILSKEKYHRITCEPG